MNQLQITFMNNYSHSELQEFKTLIESKLKQATETHQLLTELISKQDNSANNTSWKSGSLEDGGDTLSREEQNIMAQKQLKFIEGLKAALVRINNKTYGICRISGELIPKERLRAVPHTTTRINFKE